MTDVRDAPDLEAEGSEEAERAEESSRNDDSSFRRLSLRIGWLL